jgi:hypothetical protein
VISEAREKYPDTIMSAEEKAKGILDKSFELAGEAVEQAKELYDRPIHKS